MPRPHRQPLATLRWTVRAVGDLSQVPASIRGVAIDATVPGCIHTDLIDAGLIRDPRIGDAEKEIQWVSWTDWRYEAEFEADERLFEHDEIDLAFDHLDTIARIELNGVEVGRAMSEFLPWQFPVREVLRPGTNHLAVTFTSPLRHVQEESARLGPRPVNGDYPAYNMIRKCASNFEWDWGPRVGTCGIARDARLEGWSVARIERVVPVWQHAGPLRVSMGVRFAASSTIVELAGGLVTPAIPLEHALHNATLGAGSCARAEHMMELDVPDHQRWSPVGSGSQAGVRLYLSLSSAGSTVSEWNHVIGFRTVHIDHSDGAFALVINNQPVYCRGANWIPEGLFPRDRTPERVRQRLEQLKAANMNMVRVWGGGRYEPDWFYDICDELGIMVWQDFMFACACYPEEEPIRSLVEQEARHHVARLARHPSVVLWCGGNECTWAHESWGFKEKLAPGQTWGEAYYNNILPRVCADVNPTVPYIPNSPFSPIDGMHPNNPHHGDTHTWEVWGDAYRTVTPRFCSEFGQQAPSNIETLVAAGLTPPAGSADVVPPLLTARQRGPGGNKRWYDDPIATWFRPPRDFEEWHYLAQLLQARSLQIGIEWQRINMPRCSGSLIWQLNDAWPGLSWSLIDADGEPKQAYFAVRSAFKKRKLTIQLLHGVPQVMAINDMDERWSGTLAVRRVSFDGSASIEATPVQFLVEPRRVEMLCRADDVVGIPASPDHEVLVAESLRHRALWYYLPDNELRYPTSPPSLEFTHHYTRKATISVSSTGLLRDAVVNLAPVVEGTHLYTPPLFTLLPGETIRLGVRLPDGFTDHAGAQQRLQSPGVLRCANHFGKSPSA